MERREELKRDQSVDAVIYGFIVALGVVSFISLSIFSLIFAIIVYYATLVDYQLWLNRFGYTKTFYGLSLIFILIVLIIFSALLMNSCIGSKDGLSYQNKAILISSAVIAGVYLINLILTIKVYLLGTDLFKPIEITVPNTNFYVSRPSYRRKPTKSTYAVTVLPVGKPKTTQMDLTGL
eukprot:TRINITY_DN12509_c0_g1_i16.p1 TRINITY_DN12509_c0_g1~~TRINITY_DN12509_c0_g1_i16.p1  ORF type:complete len:179 (+),score=39.06 TRINITY_DN12509_c0_g1_i16:97-633(+)